MIQSSAWGLFEEMGAVKALRKAILRRATKAFGPPTAEQQATFTAIEDVGRLDRLLDRADRVKSWDALLRGK